jgi:hypothetical protein
LSLSWRERKARRSEKQLYIEETEREREREERERGRSFVRRVQLGVGGNGGNGRIFLA